jgi:hypothetical protein
MLPRRARNRLFEARRFHSRKPAPAATSETDPEGAPTPKDRHSVRFGDIAHPIDRCAVREEAIEMRTNGGGSLQKRGRGPRSSADAPPAEFPYVLQTDASDTGMAAVLYTISTTRRSFSGRITRPPLNTDRRRNISYLTCSPGAPTPSRATPSRRKSGNSKRRTAKSL